MEWLTSITAFDVLVLLVFVAFLARGIWIGFIRQISSLVAMIGGFALAGYFDNDFYSFILPYIDNSHISFIIAYILLFVVFFYLIKLIGLGLKKVMDVTLTPWFDRTVGGLFGFIKGAFFVCLLFIVVSSFMSGSNNYLKKSVSYPVLSAGSRLLLAFIQDHDIRSYFTAKEPAIRLPLLKDRSEGEEARAPIVTPEEEKAVEDDESSKEQRKIFL